MIHLKSVLIACSVALFLPFITGCPCLNNPCDDGLICNGVETCTDDGGQAICVDGDPIECPKGQVCTEPSGECVGQECLDDTDCDDGDICTVDTCTDGTCLNEAVECVAGETCDPQTGDCVAAVPTSLQEAGGVYTGARTCGDDDGEVTLAAEGGMLTLSGFSGNGDISLTPTDDTTATASNVVAFGVPGHTLTLTLDPLTGEITFDLATAGTCSTTLVPKQ